MEYRFLGRTGLRVAALCMGCMTFEPGMVDEETAYRMLDRYVEAGGNFFDMADNYTGVEEKYGRWLKMRGNRQQHVIATKVRFPVGTGPNDVGLTRKHIMDSIDSSLKKLGTDYIDLYQAHCWDQITPIEETMRTFDDLVSSGKVRYIGISNFAGWHVMKTLAASQLHNWIPVVSNQIQYSLLTRSPEWEIFPVCNEHGVSLNAWSPLAAGWLSGKYQKDKLPPPDSRMARVAKTKEEWEKILKTGVNNQIPHPTRIEAEKVSRELAERHETERRWMIIDAVGDIAKARGKTHSQVALAWLLARTGICSAIMGVSTMAQMEENLGSLGWALSKEETEWLDTVSDPGLPYPHDFFIKYGIWR